MPASAAQGQGMKPASKLADEAYPDLLSRQTLGLQLQQYAKYVGPTDEHDYSLLDLRLYDDARDESIAETGTFRKVGPTDFFHQFADADQPGQAQDLKDLDTIEQTKDLFLERYASSYRVFSPPLLAAVYILASNWWSYEADLAKHHKPDVSILEEVAFRSLQETSQRPKIATVQAGLLLLQRPRNITSWQLTCQVVAIAQDLGLHLDCSSWRIPVWERALRRRLAWALFNQDTWSALIYARPPHISLNNWAVQPVSSEDFPDDAVGEDEDIASEVEKGRTLFNELISLSKMLNQVLEKLYSLQAELDIQHSYDATKAVLERAKPIQVRLKSWWAELPDNLRMDATKSGALSSVGYLHLAYFATEITLHRRILRSLSPSTDPYLVQICRSAAKARLISAMDFFNRLKPEHLQSFWYFCSKFNFALIGTFAGLCFVTSVSQEEAEFYQRRLMEYRWTLRVSNKSAEFLEIASGILESAVGSLLKAADSIDSRKLEFPMLNAAVTDGYMDGESGSLDTDMEGL
ncbi:Transcriptional activator protein DAL81 [Cyphellophora attinorum]|uniref:Transcriptional activator protein DAL81 n=1 Tax=Cyphellophora attinorum TaxID=1664694 RepID=A0A0N1H7R4_9EURO|nr:Transcriptional activator protein DAL81 [Phialophora attinorum]KPI38820.1 Transcriptional activator protein DAL81 [Phialophora attinorum]